MEGKRIRAVIFDMDGVIFDSERLLLESWQVVAARHGFDGIEETLQKCFGVNVTASRRFYFERYGDDFPLDVYKAEAAELFWARCAGTGHPPVKPGARELLAFLRDRNVPLALASSTRSEVVRTELERAGLLDFFRVVIGGDQIPRSKPEPDIFLAAAAALGEAPADCAVIEDSFNGVRAARAAGTRPVMVPDMVPPDGEMAEKAEVILPDLDAARDYLAERL